MLTFKVIQHLLNQWIIMAKINNSFLVSLANICFSVHDYIRQLQSSILIPIPSSCSSSALQTLTAPLCSPALLQLCLSAESGSAGGERELVVHCCWKQSAVEAEKDNIRILRRNQIRVETKGKAPPSWEKLQVIILYWSIPTRSTIHMVL